jgi:hypothetical protein
MSEETKWVYRYEVIGFSFGLFFSREKQILDLCSKLGEEGWEVCGFTFNCLNWRYILIFKKRKS